MPWGPWGSWSKREWRQNEDGEWETRVCACACVCVELTLPVVSSSARRGDTKSWKAACSSSMNCNSHDTKVSPPRFQCAFATSRTQAWAPHHSTINFVRATRHPHTHAPRGSLGSLQGCQQTKSWSWLSRFISNQHSALNKRVPQELGTSPSPSRAVCKNERQTGKDPQRQQH